MTAHNRNFIEDPPEEYWSPRPVVNTFQVVKSDGPFRDEDGREWEIHSLRRDRCYQSRDGRGFRVYHEIQQRFNGLSIQGVSIE